MNQTPENVSSPAYTPGDSPAGVGTRFRRPLTQDELATIETEAKREEWGGGLDGAFRATWDILLGEAEGMTMEQASDAGLRFHPAEYAIPDSQSETLLAIWKEHRGPKYKESSAGMLWMNMGPGTYPDGDA